jgi:hypothetical protein
MNNQHERNTLNHLYDLQRLQPIFLTKKLSRLHLLDQRESDRRPRRRIRRRHNLPRLYLLQMIFHNMGWDFRNTIIGFSRLIPIPSPEVCCYHSLDESIWLSKACLDCQSSSCTSIHAIISSRSASRPGFDVDRTDYRFPLIQDQKSAMSSSISEPLDSGSIPYSAEMIMAEWACVFSRAHCGKVSGYSADPVTYASIKS